MDKFLIECRCDTCIFNQYCPNLETIEDPEKCKTYVENTNEFLRDILDNAHFAGYQEGYDEAVNEYEENDLVLDKE